MSSCLLEREKKKISSHEGFPTRVSPPLVCPEYFGEASAGEDAVNEAACVCVGGRGGGWN